MNKNAVVKVCKDLGCCDSCCLRYLGVKNAKAYKKDPKKFLIKYEDNSEATNLENQLESSENNFNKDSANNQDSISENVTNSDKDNSLINSNKEGIINPDIIKDKSTVDNSKNTPNSVTDKDIDSNGIEKVVSNTQNELEAMEVENDSKKVVKQLNSTTDEQETSNTEEVSKSNSKNVELLNKDINKTKNDSKNVINDSNIASKDVIKTDALNSTLSDTNTVEDTKDLSNQNTSVSDKSKDTIDARNTNKIDSDKAVDTTDAVNTNKLDSDKAMDTTDAVNTNKLDSDKAMDTTDAVNTNIVDSDKGKDTVGDVDETSSPVAKKMRSDICVSCLGVLQPNVWEECVVKVKELLDSKRYECTTLACALSSPIATILREKAIVLTIKDKVPQYDTECVTSLKEAWKWSFCPMMCERVGKTLDSGAVSPLLATFCMDYDDDYQELEVLKTLSPGLFKQRAQQRRRFAVEFTRASVEQALCGVTLTELKRLDRSVVSHPSVKVKCVSVHVEHSPVYLGGRYLKLSRELPQSPWILQGKRMMEGSVQETIFKPLADMLEISSEDAEHRLKFIAAGREDVDVRCLGDGRPFAIEISDPRRRLTATELAKACDVISRDNTVIVKKLVYVTKEDLTRLKQGEETKCKTYEALCIKLEHSQRDIQNGKTSSDPVTVTPEDIETINNYRNNSDPSGSAVILQQKTPLRVLHRRPLLCRTREIAEMKAYPVPEHPQLLVLRVRTSAGAYVKEWCHGDLARTTPALCNILAARTDILNLDVTDVALHWP